MRRPVYDEFNDYELVKQLNKLIEKLPKAKELKQHLTLDISPYPNPPPVPSSNEDFILKFNETKVDVLVEQICLVDHYLLSSISPEELENQNWNNSSEEQDKAPNITRLVQRFNDFSSWITHYILNADNTRERTTRYNKISLILDRMISLNNFSAMRAIHASLESVPIMVPKFLSNFYFPFFYFLIFNFFFFHLFI